MADDDAVIELLSDDDDDDESIKDEEANKKPAVRPKAPPKKKAATKKSTQRNKSLQVGVVLEEDLHSHEPHEFLLQQKENNRPLLLYHDPEFESAPASVEGTNRGNKVEKCRCKAGKAQPVQLRYIQKGPNKGRPYHGCHLTKSQGGCMYFRWAFRAQSLHWYRFGDHTGHTLVQPTGFSANDLVQGKVGDCWFLSALAVVAERPDLIQRLFDCFDPNSLRVGLVQVNLFLDGFWKTVTIDNFLPCSINDKAESELQKAISASMGMETTTTAFQGNGHTLSGATASSQEDKLASSKYDPFALSDKNRQVLADTQNFLDDQNQKPAPNTNGKIVNPYAKKKPPPSARPPPGTETLSKIPQKLQRAVTTQDLAYSKAQNQQLWVPFLEKAYAKSHGCYQAISGGWMAEAFLDLTGAPTLQFALSGASFEPRAFWSKLLSWRHQRLPMACATAQSQVGLIGMHAYSILDVREIKNVSWEFFRDKLEDRTLGNVSGFTEMDGTVRFLRIRNPHGRGEWKGEFSDQSDIWEKLLIYSGTTLERTMKNDGTFWIDYDSFLLGFSHVDVVLAFEGNHARSFDTNFPEKKSNQRCTRAFEVCLLDDDDNGRDTVELYVMGIQKTRRGAYHGRSDRKVSYKICDMGILVGEHWRHQDKACMDDEEDDLEDLEFTSVQGEMLGFARNGHTRLILDRKKNKRLIVMPISYGHPAATDKERSFAIRFVADAPLLIRELPKVPRLDRALYTFCFGPQRTFHDGQRQRQRKVLLEGPRQHNGEPLYRIFQINCTVKQGGAVLVYLCVNHRILKRGKGTDHFNLHLNMEATCRGMMCRTETGFLTHETMAKGKKFEAVWRKFVCDFHSEDKSRLLMVLVQSGQDCQLGSITFRAMESSPTSLSKKGGQTTITATGKLATPNESRRFVDYQKLGIFNGDCSLEQDDQHHLSLFGPNLTDRMTAASPIGGADLELERALALSRGDLEMQQALERSKHETTAADAAMLPNGTTMTEEQAMQLALERSKAQAIHDGRDKSQANGFCLDHGAVMPSVGYDDLNEAIKRSLAETKQPPEASKCSAVVDLVEDEDEERESSPAKPAKRIKTKDDVIDIADSDDDDGGDVSGATVEAKEEKTKCSAHETSNVEDKRRLAAEAAERRFQS